VDDDGDGYDDDFKVGQRGLKPVFASTE